MSALRFGALAAVFAAVLALGLALPSSSPHARDYIINYDKRLPNGKLCRVVLGDTHIHAGNASDPSKARSKARAIQAWADFTRFEYGDRYDNWRAADKHSMVCAYDSAAKVWRCRAEAQPCREGARRARGRGPATSGSSVGDMIRNLIPRSLLP